MASLFKPDVPKEIRLTTKTENKERVRPSTQVYRTFMAAIEARRRELDLPMAQIDDLAGTNDGHFAHLIAPDTPRGRQGRWESLELIMSVLFGDDYRIQIVAQNYRAPARVETRAKPSAKPTKACLHWRHRQIFSELGRRGAEAFKKLPPERRSEAGRKAAATRQRKRLEMQATAEPASNH